MWDMLDFFSVFKLSFVIRDLSLGANKQKWTWSHPMNLLILHIWSFTPARHNFLKRIFWKIEIYRKRLTFYLVEPTYQIKIKEQGIYDLSPTKACWWLDTSLEVVFTLFFPRQVVWGSLLVRFLGSEGNRPETINCIHSLFGRSREEFLEKSVSIS